MTSFIPLSSCFFSTHFFLVRGTAIPTIILIRSKNARREKIRRTVYRQGGPVVVTASLKFCWQSVRQPTIRRIGSVPWQGLYGKISNESQLFSFGIFSLDVFLILWIQKSSLNDQFLSHYWGFVKKYSDNSRVMMNDTNPNFSHYFLKEILQNSSIEAYQSSLITFQKWVDHFFLVTPNNPFCVYLWWNNPFSHGNHV